MERDGSRLKHIVVYHKLSSQKLRMYRVIYINVRTLHKRDCRIFIPLQLLLLLLLPLLPYNTSNASHYSIKQQYIITQMDILPINITLSY